VTSFLLRTDRSQQLPSLQGTHVLDLFPRDRAATVHIAGSLLDTLDPSQAARDLLVLAAGVYAADKVTPRELTGDGFTREFELSVPVAEHARFSEAREGLERTLSFLTGDAWTLRFRRIVGAPRQQRMVAPETKSVALFSGGLDSLAGAIDLLSSEPLVLVGHHESGPTAHRQTELAEKLRAHYGDSHVQLRQLLLGPARANKRQAAPLPGAREETTRGRSFLFIAAGLALADTIDPNTPLYLPENGFIGINVPLVPARSGALSTRTTHPYFLTMMRDALDTLGLAGHQLENPFRLQTKGEILQGSANSTLLAQLAPRSVSCAHPTAGRWDGETFGNCGTCWPCMIRRASMHRAGWDSVAQYATDVLHDAALLEAKIARGASLRAVIVSLTAPPDDYAVLRNGPIPGGEAMAFGDVYRRGRRELMDWIRASGPASLRSLVAGA
jgi:7-cyano-7-deazaguanine synthase in queuosine biosynthesis